MPGATMSLQKCHIQGHVLGHCQVPPLCRSATSRISAKCHHVPSPAVPHPVLALGHCQVPPRPPLAVPHPGSHPGTLPGATTLQKCHIQVTSKCHHVPSPAVPHPGSLPSATTSSLSRATSRVTSLDTARCHHVLSPEVPQVPPCPFPSSATPSAGSWGTARCHHILPWQCHIQGHVLGHCQVPPLCRSATPRVTSKCHHVLLQQCHTQRWLLDTARCHHSAEVPHPGYFQVSPCPFSRSATSRVTSLGTARCHHVPSPAVPHPGSRPWALPGATTSSPADLGGLWCLGGPHAPGRICWNWLWHR
ncbi:uncharacterized protein LOC130264236 [Oenanthe melanoleuca]|uniref:uncharacterized protein LOC130264236 n=1 Tax=Oenanthe melanoleuca TaxID=2939378 RepID=UPI0024C1544C|nr:uncharacterized protein LOC130264236 [Oenanthe melanoleuca]